MPIEDPAELLRLLYAEGYAVAPIEGRVRVAHPARPLPEERKVEIRRHRDALFGLLVDETVAAVLAASPENRAGWRGEVTHAALWAAAGRFADPCSVHDLAALRRIVPPGRCLRCDDPTGGDGDDWCARCLAATAQLAEGAR